MGATKRASIATTRGRIGRSALWIFAILTIEGVLLQVVQLPAAIQQDETVQNVLPFFAYGTLLLGPPGVVASLGLMRGLEWARKAMMGLLWIGVACVVLWWAWMSYAVLTGELVLVRYSTPGWIVKSGLVTLVMGGALACTALVLTKAPEEEVLAQGEAESDA